MKTHHTSARPQHRLGEPQTSGPLTVFPILGPPPGRRYLSLGQAVTHGATVTERDARGHINEVLVVNPGDLAVLLYEGELILGARQHRTIDCPVLVPAGARVPVPVSCVEQDRWEDAAGADAFVPAPYAIDPELRRDKRARANRIAMTRGFSAADQLHVWSDILRRLDEAAVVSETAAFSDLFEARHAELAELIAPFRSLPDQLGAVAAVDGIPVALDLVGRPGVFADLFARLLQGYALHALRHAPPRIGESVADPVVAWRLLERALDAPRRWTPTPGMGDGFTLRSGAVIGGGLQVGSEVVALSAYPERVASR